MMGRNISNFIGCESRYEDSDFVLFGAPFDSTTSYRPGTRFASAAIRNESYGLETYSPYQDRDLTDYRIYDGGDLELPFGAPEKALLQIEEYIDRVFQDGKVPVMVGGEHLVTLGAVRSAVRHYPDLHIIQFDAHADLRDDYLGMKLSHATVLRRCYELTGDNKIFQFGIRSGDREEFYWAKDHVVMQKFNFNTLPQIVEQLKGKPIYFTLDLDVMDSSVFPGTGTPEAGGVTFMELLEAIRCVGELDIIGADINELCPVYDQTGSSTATACKIVREMLLCMVGSR